jgi:hypothetical protein
MGPNPKGTHRHVCVSPHFAIRGRSAFCTCGARIRVIQKGAYLRLDAVHAAIKHKGAVSIVNGNVCGRFHECWHGRFVVFCDLLQVHLPRLVSR